MAKLPVKVATRTQKADPYYSMIKPSKLIDIPDRIMSPDYVPDNTQTAFKMFRTDGNELFPLFVDANTPVNVGEWQKAIVGDQAPSGKVKSKIGQLAYRPGWHAGSNAAALHIGGKVDPATGQRVTGPMPPNTREPHQVWAEVSMADDLDWQSVANAQGGLTKAGKPKLRDMHITDGVPYGGSYRYKTNSNMEGDWLIGGDMRVNRVLSDEEVADINAAQGYDDLPRRERSDLLPGLLEKYGKPGMMLGAGGLSLVLAGQSGDADASVERLTRRGLELVEDVQDPKTGESIWKLLDDGNEVAQAHMNAAEAFSGAQNALDFEVSPSYRRQGIGNEFYDAIEEVSGKPVRPSPWLSMDGVHFWGNRDPDSLAWMVNNDKFYDPDNHGKVETYLEQVGHPDIEGSIRERPKVKLRGFGDQAGNTNPSVPAATSAAVRRIKSLLPLGTLGAISSLTSEDASAADLPAGILDVANRTGEMLVNDALTGSQSLSNAIYDTRDVAPQVQFAPRTEAGDTLSEGILSDLGNVINYRGLGGNMPSIGDAVEGGINFYNEHVSPYLSDRQEMALGGSLLAASTLMPGSKRVTNTADTRLGKQTKAANKKMLENPTAALREELSSEGDFNTVVTDVPDSNLPILKASELENAALMPVQGDRTLVGNLEKIQGIDIDPLRLEGGPFFPIKNDNAWASTKNIANSFQDKVQKVAEDAGTENVLGLYAPMRVEAANFSTMPTEAALRQIQSMLGAGADFDPKMVEQINSAVRNSVVSKDNPKAKWGDFPGILSPDAEEFLTQRLQGISVPRKAMLNEMKKAPYRDAGFPLVDQIYRDVSVPEMLGLDVGEGGDIVLQLDPRGSTGAFNNHRTYDTSIPGGIKGRLGDTASFGELFPQAYQDLEGAMTTSKLNEKTGKWSTPRLLNNLEKVNTTAWNKPGSDKARTKGYQLATDEYIDELVRLGLLLDE